MENEKCIYCGNDLDELGYCGSCRQEQLLWEEEMSYQPPDDMAGEK